MAIQIGARPASIDGCMQTWVEKPVANTIRTNMENPADIKVRRRTTSYILNIDCSVTLKSTVYDDFNTWFHTNCQDGVLPTRIKRPKDGVTIVARFADTPQIEFLEKDVFRATMKFEQLPAYKGLS